MRGHSEKKITLTKGFCKVKFLQGHWALAIALVSAVLGTFKLIDGPFNIAVDILLDFRSSVSASVDLKAEKEHRCVEVASIL